jgi:hypothetical protein
MENTTMIETQHIFDLLEQTGMYVCFEFQGASIGFYCDDDDFIEWFSKYFDGYFVTSKRKSADAVIYSTQDDRLFHTFRAQITPSHMPDPEDYVELQLQAQASLIYQREVDKKNRVDETCYIVAQAERRVLIASPGTVNARRATVKRTIRNMMKLLLIERGWLPVHASACVKNGVGICLLGGKFAGKTSTLLNLLSLPDTDLVSNDTLFIRDAGNYLEGCGFPNKAGIRIGTLLANPSLLSWIEKTTETFYPQIDIETIREILMVTPPAELSNRPEKIILLPTELVKLLQISIEQITPIQHFIVVQFDPTLDSSQLVPIDKEQIISHLAPHFRSLSTGKQHFLHMLFSFDETVLRMKFISLLTKYTSEISMQILAQNAGTNAHSQALVDTLVGAYIPATQEETVVSTTGPLE